MLFDEETRYWQEEYRKGNLDDIDMLGETRCLLDGTAEREFYKMIKRCILSVPTILLMVMFAFFQTRNNIKYMELYRYLQDCGISFGTNIDPYFCIIVYSIVLTVVLNITVTRWVRRRSTHKEA